MSTPVAPPQAVRSSLPEIFLTDELPRPYPSIFYYAFAGVGKTNALRTLAEFKPLIIPTEQGSTKGMSTLKDMKFPMIPVGSIDEIMAVLAELQARSKPGELYYKALGPFNALAVDSFTGLGAMLEAASKKVRGWDMIWDSVKGSGKDPRTAYPYINERGKMVYDRIINLPVPTIVTCREQLITEGEAPNTKTYSAPELPGQKLHRELPGWPEASLRLTVVNGQRCFITENQGDVLARVRLPEGQRLPTRIKPDLGLLIKLLRQGPQDPPAADLIKALQLENPRAAQAPPIK